MSEIIRGSCLCGGIDFDVDGPLKYMSYCHCSQCRKFTGSAMAVHTVALREAFRLIRGKELLRKYKNEAGVVRAFCMRCGSSLFGKPFDEPGPGFDTIYVGVLDDDPGVRPMMHFYTKSKASWFEITDDLPQFAEKWE